MIIVSITFSKWHVNATSLKLSALDLDFPDFLTGVISDFFQIMGKTIKLTHLLTIKKLSSLPTHVQVKRSLFKVEKSVV